MREKSLPYTGFYGLTMVILVFSLVHTRPGQKISLWMIGDSTMSHKPDTTHPERGWGMYVQDFFSEDVVVKNRAMNGRSTRSFIFEGRWDAVTDSLKRGDFVVIQFGHNDIHKDRPARYATPEEYRFNLRRFVIECRQAGATPILCTPIMRRRFDEGGQFYDTHGEYPGIMREVAKDLEVVLIDMQTESEKIIKEYGEEGSKDLFLHFPAGSNSRLPEGLQDDTHFSEMGASIMAEIFVNGVKAHLPGLANRLK